jgi:NAD(P)-dependent dehydrogenase (short-subunit alcohol dehydrogenase family)
MSSEFAGKTVLITGAGSGIGRATALAFANKGASVVLVDLVPSGLKASLMEIGAKSRGCMTITADISDETAVQSAFKLAVERFGRIDFAINAAGVTHASTLTADISLSDWDRVMRINVTGTWLCMREELKHMAAHGGGAIVNIASLAGLRTLAMLTAYVSSKHAVIGLTKNAAVEYGPQAIRINAIAPGGTMTAMVEGSVAGLSEADREAAFTQIASYHPLGRIGTAVEIANAAVFLCSEGAAFVTGACLSVDGGWAAT